MPPHFGHPTPGGDALPGVPRNEQLEWHAGGMPLITPRSLIYRKSAFGTARLSGSVSKYASWAKLKKEAMKLVGIDWIALLYVITESL